MSSPSISVFLIDDHPIVEAGLRLGFGLSEDFALIGTALNHDAALERLDGLQPDVIITDLVIDGELDFRYLPLYRQSVPSAHLVAFSSLSEDAYGPKCRAAGADGFISKSTSPHELVKALRGILTDIDALPSSDDTAKKPTRQAFMLDGVRLTKREHQVAERLARGLSIQSIAEGLGVSKKTAAIHRDNLRGKLNCATSNELIALLARNAARLQA